MSEEIKTEETENVTSTSEIADSFVVGSKTETTKTDGVSKSIGAGGSYFNGPCGKCGAKVCNGKLNKDGKVSCLTCKQEF